MYDIHTLLTKAESKILMLFLDLNKHYFAEISRKTKLTKPRTLRALRKLIQSKIFESKNEANIKYYNLTKNNITYSVLAMIEYAKTKEFLKKQKTLKRALNMIDEKYKNALISLIFGSYAKGYATKKSDVDLLLIKENFSKNEIKKIENIIDLVNGRTGLRINPHLMKLSEFKAKNKLALEAIETHYLLRGAELFFKMVIE